MKRNQPRPADARPYPSAAQVARNHQQKRRKGRVFDRILLLLIIACIATAAYLLIGPMINKYHQDQITNDLNSRIDAGNMAPIKVHKNANPVAGESYDLYGNQNINFDDLPEEVELYPLGRIEIPSIHVNLPVLEGATTIQLRYGLAHVSESAQPGQDGNAAILGHRMLDNGRHLNRLDEVKVGDKFYFKTPTDVYTYEVIDMPVIDPDELPAYIDKDYGTSTITLITCHPIPSWEYRLLCVGKLVSHEHVETPLTSASTADAP